MQLKNITFPLPICRYVKCDLWGIVLTSKKPIMPLFKAFYRSRGRRFDISVLRIDILRPRKITKRLSRFAQVVLDRRRLSAFYGISPSTLMRLAKRSKNLANNTFKLFVAHLESVVSIVSWRAGFFKLPSMSKTLALRGLFFVNHQRVSGFTHRLQPGDLLSFDEIVPWFNIPKSLYKRRWKFRCEHLVPDYRTFSLSYLHHPNPLTLFHYFPMKYHNVFFATRYRTK